MGTMRIQGTEISLIRKKPVWQVVVSSSSVKWQISQYSNSILQKSDRLLDLALVVLKTSHLRMKNIESSIGRTCAGWRRKEQEGVSI